MAPEPPAVAARVPARSAQTPNDAAPKATDTSAETTERVATPSPASNDREPSVLSRSAADYPAQARQRHQDGWVELEFTVTPQGRVTDVQVLNSQPKNLFDASAQRSVAKWTFAPGTSEGVPVAKRVRTTVQFEAR